MLIREKAAEIALGQQGVHEVGTSNWGPRVKDYLASAGVGFPAAWCLAFVHWCYRMAGFDLGGDAYVGALVAWARQHGYVVARPLRWDLVAYEFGSDGGHDDHVGIVLKVLAIRPFRRYLIRTVEGNTSPQNIDGSQTDGGGVHVRWRWVNPGSALFVRVPGEVRDTPRKPKPPAWYVKAEKLAPLWAWMLWRDNGAPKQLRPPQIPRTVKPWWWPRYVLHRRGSR